jgi:hypothetical protein
MQTNEGTNGLIKIPKYKLKNCLDKGGHYTVEATHHNQPLNTGENMSVFT